MCVVLHTTEVYNLLKVVIFILFKLSDITDTMLIKICFP